MQLIYKTVGIVGTGAMGRGIAQIAAQAGSVVKLMDAQAGAAEKACEALCSQWDKLVEKGRIDASVASGYKARLRIGSSLVDLSDCDLVIEAIVERLDIKKTLFAELETIVPAQTVLASNTSSLSVTAIAAALKHPERFAGYHFFNPVPLMKVVEVIAGLKTDKTTCAALADYARQMGHTPVQAQDTPGFIVNRVLMPMINEACFALGEGVATIRDIDTACQLGLNHPMGPLTLADFIGLDTCLDIINVLFTSTGDPKFRPAPLLQKYVEAGWYGRKVKRGFYDYTGDTPVPTR